MPSTGRHKGVVPSYWKGTKCLQKLYLEEDDVPEELRRHTEVVSGHGKAGKRGQLCRLSPGLSPGSGQKTDERSDGKKLRTVRCVDSTSGAVTAPVIRDKAPGQVSPRGENMFSSAPVTVTSGEVGWRRGAFGSARETWIHAGAHTGYSMACWVCRPTLPCLAVPWPAAPTGPGMRVHGGARWSAPAVPELCRPLQCYAMQFAVMHQGVMQCRCYACTAGPSDLVHGGAH